MTYESRWNCTFDEYFHFIQTETMSSIGTIAFMITIIHSLAVQCDYALTVNHEVAAKHCNPLVMAIVIAFAYLHRAAAKASSLSFGGWHENIRNEQQLLGCFHVTTNEQPSPVTSPTPPAAPKGATGSHSLVNFNTSTHQPAENAFQFAPSTPGLRIPSFCSQSTRDLMCLTA